MKFYNWSLQMFADTAIGVNTFGGTAEPYKGTTTSNSNLSVEDKTWYETELLRNARQELFYQQFAKKIRLPANHGRTVEVRRPNRLPHASVLTEGVVPNGTEFGVSNITDSLSQVGMYVPVSDLVALHGIDPIGQEITEELGASMGETWDSMTRDDAVAGTNVMYADKVSGGSAVAVTSRGKLDATAKLTSEMVARVATALAKTNTPKINGKYVGIIHPSVAHDLRRDPEWIDAHKYAQPGEIYNGEIGELHGVRFCQSTNAKILRGDDLASNSRTLAINYANGYSGAITSVAFDGGTVADDALIGRTILINGIPAVVTDNTASSITFASTNFGSIANDTVIYPGEGAGEGLACYLCLFFGKDAYGTVDPEGGGARMIIKNEKEVGGPLEQFGTFGYKGETNGAMILYQERMVRLECCSRYSSIDEAN
jgi:N4-gp56 family major capsid protein